MCGIGKAEILGRWGIGREECWLLPGWVTTCGWGGIGAVEDVDWDGGALRTG